MVSLSAVTAAVVNLIVAGVIFYLLNWLIDYVNLADPFKKVARIVLAVAAVIVAIVVLLSLVGYGPFFRP